MDRIEKVRRTINILVDYQFSFDVSQKSDNYSMISINSEYWELHFEFDNSDYVKIEELYPGKKKSYTRLIEWVPFECHLENYIEYLVDANDNPKLIAVPMTVYCGLKTISERQLIETINDHIGVGNEFTLKFKDYQVTLSTPEGKEESWVLRD